MGDIGQQAFRTRASLHQRMFWSNKNKKQKKHYDENLLIEFPQNEATEQIYADVSNPLLTEIKV